MTRIVCSLACVVGLILALASAPALAQTEAACKQEYAAKKAAGETGEQTQASYVQACLPGQADSRAENIANHDTEKLSNTDLAKESQNPIGNLYVIPFNNYSTFGFGPNGQSRGTLDTLEIQPVVPIHLNDEWNIIARGVIPLVWTSEFIPCADRALRHGAVGRHSLPRAAERYERLVVGRRPGGSSANDQ